MLDQVGEQRATGLSSLQIQQHTTDVDARHLRAALYVWDQRERARSKFGDFAPKLFGDSDGFEMASSLAVARHRATRFGNHPVVDLCCGIGGDLMALAERGPCVGVDVDLARLHMARANVESLPFPAHLVAADAAQAPVSGNAAVVDPARRQGSRRVRSGADYEPSLQLIDPWRERFSLLAVKVSPALDLDQLPSRQEVEYVSWQGQCREAVLWFSGETDGIRRRATRIIETEHLARIVSLTSASDDILRPPLQPIGAVLYDPDPALVRSHLIGELAMQLGAWSIAEEVAYLSSDEITATPWARCFRVLEQVPFQLTRLQRVMRSNGWRPGSIRRRHFPIEPEVLRKQLGRFESDADAVELVCTRIKGKRTVVICAPVVESAR